MSGEPRASWTVQGAARNLVKRFSRTHGALVWEVTIGGDEIEMKAWGIPEEVARQVRQAKSVRVRIDVDAPATSDP